MSVLDMSRIDISRRDGQECKSEEGVTCVGEGLQKKYIPMTETIYYTLLAVTEPRHGYAIIQYVRELTKGRIILGTGTLYTMVGRLQADELIAIVPGGEKKAYRITEAGLELLKAETQRLKEQLEDGNGVLAGLQ